MTRRRLLEAVGVGASGAVLAAATGSVVGVAVPASVVGALNGVISGWRGVYEWNRSRGLLAFVLDSTWSLPMTTAGVFANVVGLAQPGSGWVEDLSRRANRHVYRRGFTPRRGYLITLGNVVSGAGDVERPRRRRLVTDHEDVHCWQARWWGPLFPVLYVGWMVAGGAVGAVVWLVARRDVRFAEVVESSAYFLNPFEWWAYSRDDHWPPSGKVDGFGWQQPCCRPLAAVQPRRAR